MITTLFFFDAEAGVESPPGLFVPELGLFPFAEALRLGEGDFSRRPDFFLDDGEGDFAPGEDFRLPGGGGEFFGEALFLFGEGDCPLPRGEGEGVFPGILVPSTRLN